MSIGIAEQCSLQCAKHGLLNLLLLIPFMAHSASPDLPTALAESLDELAALVHRLLIRSPEAFWSEQTVEEALEKLPHINAEGFRRTGLARAILGRIIDTSAVQWDHLPQHLVPTTKGAVVVEDANLLQLLGELSSAAKTAAAEDVASHLEGAIRAVAASVTGRDARHVPEKAPPYALGEDRATDASAVQGQADVWRADRASDASSNVDFRDPVADHVSALEALLSGPNTAESQSAQLKVLSELALLAPPGTALVDALCEGPEWGRLCPLLARCVALTDADVSTLAWQLLGLLSLGPGGLVLEDAPHVIDLLAAVAEALSAAPGEPSDTSRGAGGAGPATPSSAAVRQAPRGDRDARPGTQGGEGEAPASSSHEGPGLPAALLHAWLSALPRQWPLLDGAMQGRVCRAVAGALAGHATGKRTLLSALAATHPDMPWLHRLSATPSIAATLFRAFLASGLLSACAAAALGTDRVVPGPGPGLPPTQPSAADGAAAVPPASDLPQDPGPSAHVIAAALSCPAGLRALAACVPHLREVSCRPPVAAADDDGQSPANAALQGKAAGANGGAGVKLAPDDARPLPDAAVLALCRGAFPEGIPDPLTPHWLAALAHLSPVLRLCAPGTVARATAAVLEPIGTQAREALLSPACKGPGQLDSQRGESRHAARGLGRGGELWPSGVAGSTGAEGAWLTRQVVGRAAQMLRRWCESGWLELPFAAPGSSWLRAEAWQGDNDDGRHLGGDRGGWGDATEGPQPEAGETSGQVGQKRSQGNATSAVGGHAAAQGVAQAEDSPDGVDAVARAPLCPREAMQGVVLAGLSEAMSLWADPSKAGRVPELPQFLTAAVEICDVCAAPWSVAEKLLSTATAILAEPPPPSDLPPPSPRPPPAAPPPPPVIRADMHEVQALASAVALGCVRAHPTAAVSQMGSQAWARLLDCVAVDLAALERGQAGLEPRVAGAMRALAAAAGSPGVPAWAVAALANSRVPRAVLSQLRGALLSPRLSESVLEDDAPATLVRGCVTRAAALLAWGPAFVGTVLRADAPARFMLADLTRIFRYGTLGGEHPDDAALAQEVLAAVLTHGLIDAESEALLRNALRGEGQAGGHGRDAWAVGEPGEHLGREVGALRVRLRAWVEEVM